MTARPRPGPGWLALLVLAGLVLSVLPARGSDGARLPPWRPARVVDATGRLVGRVIDAIDLNRVSVWVQAGERDLMLVASPDRLQVLSLGQAVFESPDCSGAAWILSLPIPSGVLLFPVIAQGPGRGVLVPDGPAVPKTIGSRLDPFVDPPSCVVVPPAPPEPVHPTLKVLDLDDWQAPFSLR